ncbi:MAG: NAD(P)/FAD-dependent oxidoreductase [Candidatus Aminicenantes bacterium]|nr:NAD(P)/FAD-dependent oxidoreductase [Candidatus Aminicenantes bacterium]
MSFDFDVAVVGAGVVGLAVAAELAGAGREICVIERHAACGQETSSRNSEVIHSGIYYPPGTLKARLCVEGKRLLYDLCAARGLPHRRTGKLVVAADEGEVRDLEALAANGRRNGVDDLALLTRAELGRMEPRVRGAAALWSPSTGILSAHDLMRDLAGRAREKGVAFLLNAEVVGLEPAAGGWRVAVREGGALQDVHARRVVNSAGLRSDAVAGLAGVDVNEAGYTLRFNKGEYFRLRRRPETTVERLVYPVPYGEGGWLGVHITVDLQGEIKLGPSAFDVDDLDYSVDPAHAQDFHTAGRRYLPDLRLEDIQPDMAGIRPKLGPRGDEGFRDFVIREESDRGLAGLVNLIGIESPGLTAALAIAATVRALLGWG